MTHTILFLAANPLGTDRLALDREARAIQVELERSGFRDSFDLETRWAAEPLDLLRELRKLRPTVVHFSGHGTSDIASARDAAAGPHRHVRVEERAPDHAKHGLYFQGPDGQPQLVSAAALADVFDAAGSSVKLVILSACYSDPQAKALLTHVDCVVGMRGSIRDDAALSFAIGFYGGLGERESVAAAFKQGCAAIGLEGLSDGDRPQLQSRQGVDPARLILASVEPRQPSAGAAAPPRRADLLTRLTNLLPSQFEEVLFRANIPEKYLPGATAPQATRAIEAIRYVEQNDRVEQLARAIAEAAQRG